MLHPAHREPSTACHPIRLFWMAALALTAALSTRSLPAQEAPASRSTADESKPSESQATGGWGRALAAATRGNNSAAIEAVEFLMMNMPPGDKGLDGDLLWDNVQLALQAREAFPWAGKVGDQLFLNDVLPYAVLDETRENWRPAMYARAAPLVQDCKTAVEAAQRLNQRLFDLVGVHYSTDRERANQSPAESIRQGKASCTGLSILLVDACRSVGIPARVAGVGKWHGKAGNHTWVEIHDGKAWRFMGADEYDPKGLDRGWFVGDASKAVAGHPTEGVYASSFIRTATWFPLAWAPGQELVPAVEVTDRYAPATKPANASQALLNLRAWRADGRVAASVRVLELDGTEVATVTTRAGQHDLNDMPQVALRSGNVYRVELTRDGITRFVIHTAEPGEHTLELRELTMGLDKDVAEAMVARLAEELLTARRVAAEATLAAEKVTAAGRELRFLRKDFGKAPAGNRSLWISMHGGGGAPTRVNDQQWQNQIKLYQPEEGIYIAPRAPTDTWNLWHQGHIDPLFDELITCMVAAEGVDPDRVYILGYSAGGDGVFQLAPRMADRFAAAAMMAGHPNETRPAGLRNLPFMIFMGGKDKAYDRNKKAAEWRDKLAELRAADPEGYPHKVTIYPDCGHWMNGQDKEALPWMAQRTRNPWPKKVVWCQDDVTHERFYWLAVAPGTAKARQTVTAEVDGNTVIITSSERTNLTLRLRDTLLDLDQPVAVMIDGEMLQVTQAMRTEAVIRRSLGQRLDPRSAATAELAVSW